MKSMVGKRLTVAAALAAALALASCEQPGGAKIPETVTEPGIEIKSAADLGKIGNDADYPLDGEYRLTKDLKLSGWTPLGTEAAPFTGKFRGNGGAVVIESFSSAALAGNYLGLFGCLQGAEIADLSVTMNPPALISLSGGNGQSPAYAGVLAAYIRGGKLKNIISAGSLQVTYTGSHFAFYAGGLAAYVTEAAAIEGSASAVTIEAESVKNLYAGGIAAFAKGQVTVTGSSALGDVTGSAPSSYAVYTGGLIGYAEGSAGASLTVKAANYTSGTVSARAYSAYSGALAAYAEAAQFRESYAGGRVSAEGTTPFAGGIAAYLSGGLVENTYTLTEVAARSITNRALAGGIAGGVSGSAEIKASYTTGKVTAEIKGSAAGPTNAAPEGAYAGGIAGAIYGSGSPAVTGGAALEGGSVAALDTASGGSLNAYRIAGKPASAGVLSKNIAYNGLPLTGRTAEDKGPDKQDGEDTAETKPGQAIYAGLGWDFTSVWRMGSGGYPVLSGQSVNIGDYTEIRTAEQLARIGKDNAYPLDGIYRIPGGTADMSVSGWTPIGTKEKPFTGSLTGNGTTEIRIEGFAAAAAELDGVGLFGYVKGSTRQKAAFSGVKVAVSGTGTLGTKTAQYTGGLAAYGEELTVEDCVVSGTMKWTKTEQYPLYSGGLVGFLKNGKISGSSSSVAVESEGQSGVYGGGVLGYGSGTLTVSGATSTGNVTVKASSHNSTAGGIVGYILGTNNSTVSLCHAEGDVSLSPAAGSTSQLMFYCGGVVGYAGNGTADMGDERSGALVEKSSYTGGTVYCTNAYPYAGGVIGYNYTGSQVKECYASGAVKAEGSHLPYAGGVAGYISGAATVENSYSHATVHALSTSPQALSGGVAGATAKPSILSKCYATGAVTATINGSSTADMGGSLGVRAGANAGGISGSLYYADPTVEKSVALNSAVSGIDTAGSGGTMYVYRIGGISPLEGTPKLADNIAWSGMSVSGGSVGDKGPDKQDGQDCPQEPAQSVYTTLGWDFGAVWKMGSGGYPVLRWQK